MKTTTTPKTMMDQRTQKQLRDRLQDALQEDQVHRDITSLWAVSPRESGQAEVVAKEAGTIAGLEAIDFTFRLMKKRAEIECHVKDGDAVKAGTVLATITSQSQTMLSAERTFLNMISHLSGVATSTAAMVAKVKELKADCQIMDTRKTLPGYRFLQKYAVRCGGGTNHRMDLAEALMVKDNHWQAGGHLKAEPPKNKMCIVEVDDFNSFKDLCHDPKIDVILLDHFSPAQLKKAVAFRKGKQPLLEASGNINHRRLEAVVKSGVDRISVGALTHSAVRLDCGLEWVEA